MESGMVVSWCRGLLAGWPGSDEGGGYGLVGTWCSARRKRRGGWIFRTLGVFRRGGSSDGVRRLRRAVIVIVAQRKSGRTPRNVNLTSR